MAVCSGRTVRGSWGCRGQGDVTLDGSIRVKLFFPNVTVTHLELRYRRAYTAHVRQFRKEFPL